MTTWQNFDQRQVLGRSGESRGSLSGLSPVRAPGAVVPKREKEEAVVEKRLGVDCGSPGKNCPSPFQSRSVFSSVTATACLPPGFGRRDGFFLVFANGEPPASFFNLPGVVAGGSSHDGEDSPPPPHPPRPIEPWHNRCRGCIHQLHSFRRRHGMDAFVAIASIDTSATTTSSS